MRDEPCFRVEQLTRLGGPVGTNSGAFQLGALRIISGTGGGWEHVSVSRIDRCPTWDEMDRVKRLFWRDDEIVMQLHVNNDQKKNVFAYCLHLWRPQSEQEISAEKERWLRAGEEWPAEYDGVRPGLIPLPPRSFV
jgi:hypothetical protein